MGRPFTQTPNSIYEKSETSIVHNYTRDVLMLPNPALILVAWCPTVWTTCLACHASGKAIQAADLFALLLKNLLVLALIYSFFCTLNTLCENSLDDDRTRARSQKVFFLLACLSRVLGTVVAIRYLLGQDLLPFWLPCGMASSLYPLVKRFVVLGQFVLACLVTAVILPSWISSGEKAEWSEGLFCVLTFTFLWIIYISILHSIVDTTDALLASTHGHSYIPDNVLTVTLLSLLQIIVLSTYSYQSAKSPHFWILGVGIWAVNNAWHISDLRVPDWSWNESSGRAAVQRNICLGLWMCAAEICELWVGGGLVF
ncbi:hypothetical protein VTL71DRAFT_5044 [Oculimacula yallundae]|uniref:Uncharacterized protein n=1 Tax=Oculimacula yallundae TaxID=86028 RepID=A0ABR4C009_9HELO